jgi:hypothetical protein
MFGTVMAPPTGECGVPTNYIECFPDVPPGPGRSFDWTPFPYYLQYRCTWSVFPEWAFPVDERRWHLLTGQRQHELHTIISALFGHTGAGNNLVAPDFPRWAYPITHEHWSRFNRGEQYVVGHILNNTHYWRGVLLPGDADFAAGLPRHVYDADVDNESDTDLD